MPMKILDASTVCYWYKTDCSDAVPYNPTGPVLSIRKPGKKNQHEKFVELFDITSSGVDIYLSLRWDIKVLSNVNMGTIWR